MCPPEYYNGGSTTDIATAYLVVGYPVNTEGFHNKVQLRGCEHEVSTEYCPDCGAPRYFEGWDGVSEEFREAKAELARVGILEFTGRSPCYVISIFWKALREVSVMRDEYSRIAVSPNLEHELAAKLYEVEDALIKNKVKYQHLGEGEDGLWLVLKAEY